MTRSVLIVDDSSVVRQALVRLFADGGFEVGLNPGLIVMDLSMPVMNGLEAARCLRQLLPTVPIILLSDYGGLFPEQEARSAGIAAIVSKAECSSVLLHEARTLLCLTAA